MSCVLIAYGASNPNSEWASVLFGAGFGAGESLRVGFGVMAAFLECTEPCALCADLGSSSYDECMSRRESNYLHSLIVVVQGKKF